MAAGEAFGRILFLLSAGFGAALLVSPRPIRSPPPAMIVVPGGTLLAGAVALADGMVSRIEGLGLIGAYTLFAVAVAGRDAAGPSRTDDERVRAGPRSRAVPGVELVLGLGLILLGATLLVGGGVRIVERTSLPAGFVGAALLGAVAGFHKALRGRNPIRRGLPDGTTGDLFGTVAAFSSLVPGMAAMIRPLVVDSAGSSAFLAASVLYALVAVVFLGRGEAWRSTGLAVVALYGLWLAVGALP